VPQAFVDPIPPDRLPPVQWFTDRVEALKAAGLPE
jgi:hypothetical protein